jgi:predicted anti-sigma-YlaC factor YlaD
MNGFHCEEVRARLDDSVDGLLDVGERAAVSFHLDACESCRQEERRLRELLARAASLAGEVAPPRDLWPDIERGIRSQDRTGAWLRGLAAAACMVLALAGVLATRGPDAQPLAPPVTPSAGVARPASLEQAAIRKLEGDYEAAASALLLELRARQSQLPPQTVAQVEESLRTIDGALAQIRAALEEDPAQPGLHLMLAATHRKKVDVLRRVMELGA